ncbi:MAG: ribosome maturation factor RimM [Sphingomicrobium sp.]
MTPPATDSERRVALAAVAGAHGVSGEVRLKLFADDLARFTRGSSMFVGGAPMRLLGIKGTAKALIARFEGVPDRTAAETLRGTLVEIERAALPALDPDEYYLADLIGLVCVDAEGTLLGVVSAVENFGASDLLEVEREGGVRSLIPFASPMAVIVGGQILLDPDFLA